MAEIKPTLTKVRRTTLHYDLAAALDKMLEKSYPFKTCIFCNNFTVETEICRIAKARPPATVIAFGCSSYEDDEIPY